MTETMQRVDDTTDTPAGRRVATWLSSFETALAAGDVEAAAAMFLPVSFWRDLVSFTWNIVTVEGPAGVAEMLAATLQSVQPRDFAASEPPTETGDITESWITFETSAGRGRGHLRLKDGGCWTLLTTLYELRGHEEPTESRRPMGAEHGANKARRTWLEKRKQEAAELGHSVQPYCVIVGGGQGGIALGARLRQLDVPTLIIERNPRAGDSWRNRYKSLCLHDPVWYDHLPYIDFPKIWPVFSPKDKLGDWLETYTEVMELNYWTSTTCMSARYDTDAGEWIVIVQRDGVEITLRPQQLVLATGMSGKAHQPEIPGMDLFTGDQHHSSQHPGPDAYRGKKAVVIGSNNSAHDISAALWEAGVDVTMVQRSSTHIVKSESLMDIALGDLYSERAVAAGMTTQKADLVVYATGYGSMNGWAADLIWQDVADKVGKLWGLGSDTAKDPGPWEGEQRNMWKPTQQEALWFHGGNLHQSRHYSLYLALQLKARAAGIPTPVYGTPKVNHLR